MARIEGAVHGEQEKDLPWENRLRIVPLRTYSGRVVYKKGKHYFSQSDVSRVVRSMEVEPDEKKADWMTRLTEWLQQITIAMMEKILPFLSGEVVAELYYLIYELLGRIFRVDTTRYTGTPHPAEQIIFQIIMLLADRIGVDIVIKPRK